MNIELESANLGPACIALNLVAEFFVSLGQLSGKRATTLLETSLILGTKFV